MNRPASYKPGWTSGPVPRLPGSASLLLCLLLSLPGGVGCSYYSFTGASIPTHLNTIAIPLVEDNSIGPITGLDEQMTRLLTDRFIGQTRLSLQPDEASADVVLTVKIDRYANEPTSVSGDERATLNRVTLTVSVVYQDRVQNEELLRQTFSNFEDYDVADLSGEASAARSALVKIADDIFNRATSNW